MWTADFGAVAPCVCRKPKADNVLRAFLATGSVRAPAIKDSLNQVRLLAAPPRAVRHFLEQGVRPARLCFAIATV